MSRLFGNMLEREMRLTDDYWRAFDRWKSHRPLGASSAVSRFSREAVHERPGRGMAGCTLERCEEDGTESGPCAPDRESIRYFTF